MVVGQQLVAGREAERAQHGIDAVRRVGHERQVVRVGADEPARTARASSSAGSSSRARKRTGCRSRRSRQACCASRTTTRAGAERAVVEEEEVGLQAPTRGAHGRQCGRARAPLHVVVPPSGHVRTIHPAATDGRAGRALRRDAGPARRHRPGGRRGRPLQRGAHPGRVGHRAARLRSRAGGRPVPLGPRAGVGQGRQDRQPHDQRPGRDGGAPAPPSGAASSTSAASSRPTPSTSGAGWTTRRASRTSSTIRTARRWPSRGCGRRGRTRPTTRGCTPARSSRRRPTRPWRPSTTACRSSCRATPGTAGWIPTITDARLLQAFLHASAAGELEAYPVSTAVNSPRNKGAELARPVAGPVIPA